MLRPARRRASAPLATLTTDTPGQVGSPHGVTLCALRDTVLTHDCHSGADAPRRLRAVHDRTPARRRPAAAGWWPSRWPLHTAGAPPMAARRCSRPTKSARSSSHARRASAARRGWSASRPATRSASRRRKSARLAVSVHRSRDPVVPVPARSVPSRTAPPVVVAGCSYPAGPAPNRGRRRRQRRCGPSVAAGRGPARERRVGRRPELRSRARPASESRAGCAPGSPERARSGSTCSRAASAGPSDDPLGETRWPSEWAAPSRT